VLRLLGTSRRPTSLRTYSASWSAPALRPPLPARTQWMLAIAALTFVVGA
jgi:hypothetical protein